MAGWQQGGNHEEKFITIIKLSRESRDLCYDACSMEFRFVIMNHKQKKSAWSAPVPIEIEIDKKV